MIDSRLSDSRLTVTVAVELEDPGNKTVAVDDPLALAMEELRSP